MTQWQDVLGGYVDACGVLREYWADADGETLAAWIERESGALWAAAREHVDEDWEALARQVERDALHGDWTIADVAAGYAQVVRCPDCGQMEIWCEAEIADQGQCRSGGAL